MRARPRERLILKLVPLVLATLLAGCSVTLPVRGTMETSKEEFSGSATGNPDGGTLTIKSKAGVTCTGNYVNISSREGKGIMNCSDKRSGPFEFASSGMRGTGSGTLDGERFTFTFGTF